MNDKTREDLVFELYYSYNLENIYYHFNARLNNLLVTIQLLLSSAIIGDLSRYFPNTNFNILIGVVLAVLSIVSLVYRFGEKAALSQVAKGQYQALIKRYPKMNDDELNNALTETDAIDNHIIGAFCDISHKRSAIQLGREDDTKLNCYQSAIAWFCGESFN